MKTLFTKLLVLLLFVFTGTAINQVQAQTPGVIYQPATNGGQKVLDPNGDGYVSKTNAGFPGLSMDEGTEYSEIPYRPFPVFMNEPLDDILTGAKGGHTDFAPRTYEDGKPLGSPLATYFDGTNFLFRIRLGGASSASVGYSVLIDTDGLFPGGTPNPGFEFEVVFANNFDVKIYDHRTNTTGGDVLFKGSYKQYSQKSVASSRAGGNADYFYDFYVPLAAFKGGITSDTPLRMSGVTISSANSGIFGSVSDVGGVDDRLYNGDKIAAWTDIINAFPPTSLNDIQEGDFPPAISEPPFVNNPIYTNSTTITGTSVEAPGSVITVYQNGVAIGTTTVKPDGTWSFPVPASVILVVGDEISATVSPTDKQVSGLSNIVIVQQGMCVTTASPPVTSLVTQSPKGFKGTTSYLGLQTFTIYRKAPDGTTSFERYTVDILASAAVAGSSPTVYNWFYEYPSNKDIAAGLYTVTVTPRNLCESQPSNEICYDGTGNSTINTRTPTITTINGAAHPLTSTLFLMPLASVGGTLPSSVSDTKLVLYINGIQFPEYFTFTNTTSWTINTSGIKLMEGDIITVRTVMDANTRRISVCGEISSIPSNHKMAAVRTASPVILGPYCGPTTLISGTSTEEVGTRINLYQNGVLISSPSAPHAYVNVHGYWTATGLNIPEGAVITARAIADDKTLSAASNSITVAYQQTLTGYSITGPVYENAVTVSGKAPAGAVSGREIVRLYIDGSATNYTTSTFVNGAWTISDIFAYDIYAGATLTIRVSSTNACESINSNAVVVECSPADRPITASMTPDDYCANTAATVNLSSSVPNAVYSLFVNNVQVGGSVAGTGYPISLSTGPLSVHPSSITVEELRIGTTCTKRVFGPFTATVYAVVPNDYTISASPDNGCPNMSTQITVAGARAGYTYQIINADTKELIGSPYTPGADGGFTFPAITVPVTSTYSLLITDTATGCSIENVNTVKITITGPDVTRAVTASNPVCMGGTATITVDTEAGYTYKVFDKSNNQQIGATITGNGAAQSVTTDPLIVAGTYTYYVEVSGAGCTTNMLTEASSTVIDPANYVVTAGNDQLICRGHAATASITLQGSDPAPGAGIWTVAQKPAGAAEPMFSSTSDRNAVVTGLVSGDYIFTWSVTTECSSGSSAVGITVNCDAVYQVIAPNYWDTFPNYVNLATAFDEDGGVKSAAILRGRIPAGSRFDQATGNIIVDYARGPLEPGNFPLTIKTTDAFGHETILDIIITIYPRGSAPTPLPVELISFKATVSKWDVLVQWQTASEKDNDLFEVRRSADGKIFETIGTMKGKGTTSQKSSYTFTDKNPLYGTSYYILKQIDYDGKSSLSRMESVTIKVAAGVQFQVFPNPFAEELNLTISSSAAGNASMQLVDMQGRVIQEKNITVHPGSNSFEVPVKNVVPGMYMIKVTGEGFKHTSKVVKTH